MSLQVSSLESINTREVRTRYRRIGTPIPVPDSIAFLQSLRKIEPRSMSAMPPIVWENAQGFLVRDPYGNQWIDFTSGIVVANAGHAHPHVMKAIAGQASASLAFSYAYATRNRHQALAALLELAPPGLDKAILFSSGTEAIECAIALMRHHGMRLSSSKIAILSFEEGYHGRTLGAKFAGGFPGAVNGLNRESAHHIQLPHPGSPGSRGFLQDIAARQADGTTVAGIILESIPGWSTAPHPSTYIAEMVYWARKHNVLLACDEVQTGFGRTGRLFGFEHYGIVPDLIACGKGLSGCLPASAVVGRTEIMDLAEPGEMSSTFGGNPFSAAAVVANLEVLCQEKLVERSELMGRVLDRELRIIAARHPEHIARLDGRGLFCSLHLRDPNSGRPLGDRSDDLALECVRRGVLLFVTGRSFLKFVPPLVIEEDALVEGVRVVGEVLDDAL